MLKGKLDAIKKFFSIKPGMLIQPESIIPAIFSSPAITQYKDLQPIIGDPYTESVEFDGHSLLLWINDIGNHGDYDQIVLEFGLYTEEIVTNYGLDNDYIGRMTIFIVPYYNGSHAVKSGTSDRLPVYNIGHLNP